MDITFIMHIRMLFSVWGTHISWLRVKQRNINFTSVEHRSKDMEWIEAMDQVIAQTRTRRDILPTCKNKSLFRLEFMHSLIWQLRSYRSTRYCYKKAVMLCSLADNNWRARSIGQVRLAKFWDWVVGWHWLG